MSTLMVDFIISLDGYGAAEGWPGLWGTAGPEYLAWIGDKAENGASSTRSAWPNCSSSSSGSSTGSSSRA